SRSLRVAAIVSSFALSPLRAIPFLLSFFSLPPPPPIPPPFPYTTLFRSAAPSGPACSKPPVKPMGSPAGAPHRTGTRARWGAPRSEEHTSELQSLTNLVCRLLLEKKKHKQRTTLHPTE